MSNELLVNIFSVLSIICYCVLYFPQIYKIIKLKTSEGLSFYYIIIWNIADTVSVISSILMSVSINLLIVSWYHYIMSCVLVIVYLVYAPVIAPPKILETPYLKSIFSSVILLCGLITTVILQIPGVIVTGDSIKLGTVIAWISVCMFLSGRLTQIYKNYVTKTTYGLSLLMYAFKIFGNSCYMTMIFLISIEIDYINYIMPWIVYCVCAISLDLFVLSQHYYLKIKSHHQSQNENEMTIC